MCFSATQALLAAKAGATYVSPFLGRLHDINIDGMELIAEIRRTYDNYGFKTRIRVASIRTPNHVKQAAIVGADTAAIPPAVIRSLAAHPLTEKGLTRSLRTGKSQDKRI